MTIEEASVNINNPDLITAIKSAIVCTNTKDTYSSGFRNGLRYVIALLTDEEPKYEDAPKQDVKTGHWIPFVSPTGIEAFGFKEMTVMNVRCSVCGAEEDVSFTGYKYCPRCGAKMEGR